MRICVQITANNKVEHREVVEDTRRGRCRIAELANRAWNCRAEVLTRVAEEWDTPIVSDFYARQA